METKDVISIQKICAYYNVPVAFIYTLNEFDLIEIVSIQNTICIYKTQIKDVEKMMRLHYELDINFEGIDAIYNLLKQVESLKENIIGLNNRLNRFEEQ